MTGTRGIIVRSIVCTLSLLLMTACGGGSVDASRVGPCGADRDTDGDGICDSDDICPGFDDAADADGDGVPDGCDPCPADADDDSDGDGVCDSDDPCPLDAPDDSDGDGVCDTDDVCPEGDDTLDEDSDGVADACDSCPLDALDDRDGDGLCDTDDPCPDDALDDTDEDGVCDSWDICPGLDDDLDADLDGSPDGCVCNALDVPAPVGVPSVPGGPVSVGFSFQGIVNGTTIEDFGFGQVHSAVLRQDIFDGLSWFCSIWWDLSEPGVATPSNAAWVHEMPVTPFAAWDLHLTNGQTDCADPGLVGSIGYSEALHTRLAIGPISEQLEAWLRMDPAVDAKWATDWEPYVMTLYLGFGDEMIGAAYVLQYDRTCDTLKQDPHTLDRVLLPKAESGPLFEFYEAYAIPLI